MRIAVALLLAACGPRPTPAPRPAPQDRFASLRAEVDAANGPAKIVATARLADALWDASCPDAEARLCVAHETAPGGHVYCSGDAPPKTTTAVPRGPEADEAAKLYREIANASPGDDDTTRAVRAARLTLADVDAEVFLAIAPPDRNADFKQTYGPWLEKSEDAERKAIEAYQAIAADPGAGEAAMIAAAQIGRMTYELGWRIITIPVPDKLVHDAAWTKNAFCDELGDKVAPIFQQASQTFGTCTKLAQSQHATGALVDMCRRASPYPR